MASVTPDMLLAYGAILLVLHLVARWARAASKQDNTNQHDAD